MRKDILSDHDILEEEVIKPNQTKAIKTNASINFTSEDLQNSQTYEEPSVPQLIKYKQQIRTENDRRLHREKLAELAKYQRNKEQSIRSDLSTKPEEIEQEKFDYDQSLSPVIIPKETKNHMKSKEEEDILNDENVFQPRKYRDRVRQRNKLPKPRANTLYIPAQQSIDVRSTLKRGDEKLVCKVCGNPVNGEDNQSIVYSQDGSGEFISYKNDQNKFEFLSQLHQHPVHFNLNLHPNQ
jgi:rubrerythrin